MEKIGKYLILEKLGHGGMGVVYKALDTLIERVVAVKMVASSLDADPELRARFFREGRAAGQLSHRNIVTVFDLGEDNGTAYIAMEFLEGEDLRATIVKGTPIDPQSKVQIMTEVCEGLAHAHERNVIHRDIKPANIFVTKTGQVKILDFGLARTHSSDLTTSGHALGTPNYMSPEQVRGEKVDCRTDIFSVGVSIYELLTHHKAFQGDSFASTIFKILQKDPEPIEHFDPGVSPDLCAIVYKALAKDRDQRYSSIREMLRDLERFCGATRTDLSTDVTLPNVSRLDSLEPRLDPMVIAAGAGTTPVPPRSSSLTPKPPGARLLQTGLFPSGPPPVSANQDHTAPTGDEAAPEASTETGAVSYPGTSLRSWRLLVAASAAVVTVAILMLVFARYRPEKTVDSSNVAAPSPVSPPVVEKTAPVVAPPVSQPSSPTAQDQEITDALDRAMRALDSHKYQEVAREVDSILKRSPENVEARSILRKAQESQTLIRTGLRNAKSYIVAGEHLRARTALDEVLKINPYDQEAQQLMGQVKQMARKSAELALGQLRDAKARAEDAHASDLAPQLLAEAKASETEANSLFAGGQFQEAAARSDEAIQHYRRAEAQARAESAALADKARKIEEERQLASLRARADTTRQGYDRERDLASQAGAGDKARDQFNDAERAASEALSKYEAGNLEGAAHDYEVAAATMRQARGLALEAARKEPPRPPEPPKPAASITSAGQPATGSRETLEATQKAIYSVPEQYKTAMESKDLSLLKSVWPTLGSQQEQALRNQWAYTRSLRLVLQKSKIEKLAGDTAVVVVQLHNEQAMNDGTSRKWNQKATFSLNRKGRSWFIESISFEEIR